MGQMSDCVARPPFRMEIASVLVWPNKVCDDFVPNLQNRIEREGADQRSHCRIAASKRRSNRWNTLRRRWFRHYAECHIRALTRVATRLLARFASRPQFLSVSP